MWWKCILTYENGKIRPVEITQRMGGDRIMEGLI
jgi:hypothetical protein